LDGFQLLIKGIYQLMNQYTIPVPDVVIIDFDDVIKAALAAEFPDIQQQICIHYIHQNIKL
jgi:hypothetical protein